MHVYLARIIGSFASAIVVWLATKFVFLQFLLEPDNLAAIVALAVGLGSTVYSLVHKRLNKDMNPADTATQPEATAHRMGMRP